LEEATKRAEDALKGSTNKRFLTLPVGDSRDDDPPVRLRDEKGSNYYFQGQDDNCVMGGLANAVFWFMGPDESDMLLKDFAPSINEFWFRFVKQVNASLKNYVLVKTSCLDILKMDDSTPVVIQLRSKDKSETHSICIFDGCIYDSSSKFVLLKTNETLNWCCGAFGFERHLRLYRLMDQKKDMKEEPQKKKSRGIPSI